MSELPNKLGAIAAAARAFAAAGESFALIGGLAVGVRSGIPRATLDVDFAILTTADRGRLIEWFMSAGFELTGEFATASTSGTRVASRAARGRHRVARRGHSRTERRW